MGLSGFPSNSEPMKARRTTFAILFDMREVRVCLQGKIDLLLGVFLRLARLQNQGRENMLRAPANGFRPACISSAVRPSRRPASRRSRPPRPLVVLLRIADALHPCGVELLLALDAGQFRRFIVGHFAECARCGWRLSGSACTHWRPTPFRAGPCVSMTGAPSGSTPKSSRVSVQPMPQITASSKASDSSSSAPHSSPGTTAGRSQDFVRQRVALLSGIYRTSRRLLISTRPRR